MRHARMLQIAFMVALTFAAPITAQQTSPPKPPAPAPDTAHKPGTAEILGLVVDSLNRQYLSGADVVIEGAKATAVTDARGRFRVTGLAPGTYQVGVFHPLLDTLGLSLATQPFHVGPDSASSVFLAVPSVETIIKRSCPPRPRAQGTSAVIGRVI